MDENTLKLLSFVVLLADHINTLNISQTQIHKHLLHPLPSDVGKHTRDTQARVAGGQSCQVDTDLRNRHDCLFGVELVAV
jgi:hypothetical protein